MAEVAEQIGPAGAANAELTQLRSWVTQLHHPERLGGRELVALLRAHGRLPAAGSPTAVGRAAAQLLTDTIERLRAPTSAPLDQQLPYLVLKACFLDHKKRFQAGTVLGMSERQVTRERTRALHLLHAELTAPRARAHPAGRAEPIPRIVGFLPRPKLSDQLTRLLASQHLVHVDGPRGTGKTCLIAEHLATASPPSATVWYQIRPGLNDTLGAFLFDLTETLRPHLIAQRADTLVDALTRNDPALASRIALHTFSDATVLLVVDDYQHAGTDPLLTGFLAEASLRLPDFTVITISRHQEPRQSPDACLHVPPLSETETAALLTQLRIDADDELATTVHRWTGGLPQLITFAATWLKTATKAEIARGTAALVELDAVQEFLLDSITELIDPDDRHILRAAAIFRDRFTDDALAYVAERSRGQVLDTSRRLVRYYLATRSHDGQIAFFHASVRDYVHARLAPTDQAEFHRRAAIWYARNSDPDEAEHHRRQAKQN